MPDNDPLEPVTIFSSSPASNSEEQKAFPLKVIRDNILQGLFDLQGKLVTAHWALYLLQFLATQTPKQVQQIQGANQIFKDAENNCDYSLALKTPENHRAIINKADAVNGLLGLAHKIEEKVFSADGQKLISDLKTLPHFLHFKNVIRDPSYVTGIPPVSTEKELLELQKRIKISEIQALANSLLELLQNGTFQLAEEETPAEDLPEETVPKETEEEKTSFLPPSDEAESDTNNDAGSDDSPPETEPEPEEPTTPQTPGETHLIDPQYQNQVAALSNASLIFLFASLGDDQSPFDFFNNLDVDPVTREQLQTISADLIYDLILKYDGRDLSDASTKIRIIQEAALKFQQDPRFRFYFQRVIDTHYIALAQGQDPQKAAAFAQKVATLSQESVDGFTQRLQHAVSTPQTNLEKEIAEKLKLVKSFNANNSNYHQDFTRIFAEVVGESDQTKAQLLASSVQDRFDYLIASHYDSFIDFLDLGKIEILIGRQINIDPSQRKAVQQQLQDLLTEYWKLRVAEHAKNLQNDGVAATWKAVTDEEKIAIGNETDADFRQRLDFLHPRGVRSAGSGKDLVAAANTSADDLPHLRETDKTVHYNYDAVEKIRIYLVQQTIIELKSKGGDQDPIVAYFTTPEGAIAPGANLNELEMLLQEQSQRSFDEAVVPQSIPSEGAISGGGEGISQAGGASPFSRYIPPSLRGSAGRNEQKLDQAIAAASIAASAYNPALGKAVKWLANKNNRKVAAFGGITGFGLLLNSLQSGSGVAGAIGGGLTGAGIGFLAGGPIGALIGGTIGAVGGGVAANSYAASKLGMGTSGIAESSANFFKGAENAIRSSGIGNTIPGTGIGGGGVINAPVAPVNAAGATATQAGTLSAVATGTGTALATPVSIGAQAVVATLATTTVGALFIVNTILPSAFLIDFTGSTGSISLDTLQESKYVTAEKVATIEGCNSTKCENPLQLDKNGDGKIEVTYTIKITPKDSYSITIADFSDIMAVSFNDELVPIEPTFTPEELARRAKTLQKIKDNQIEGSEVFFDANGDTITIQPGQALIWEYTEFFDERYNDASVRNTFEMDFSYFGAGESGSDTVVTAERICFGECPDGLGCWPTTGNSCQMPYGDFSHGPGSGNSYTTYADAIDICNAEGTPVYSPFDGEACFISCDGGYGCHLELTPDSSYGISEKFMFAHFNEKPAIFNSGNCVSVTEGTFLSPMGSKSSKDSYANPHLHFEVSNGGSWYNADPTFSYLLSIMPDGLSPEDKNSAIRSCYDE